MGMILKHATVELAKHIDALAVRKCTDYPSQFLYSKMKHTDKVKARLLYYFPLMTNNDNDETKKETKDKVDTEKEKVKEDINNKISILSPPKTVTEDSWIGWHNDSGFLTALGGDLYVNHETGQVVECPDPTAGLYVADRNQQARRVVLPNDCMAVQIGECTQIVTGGAVRATPHCVRGATNAPNIARISLPCFVDTPPYETLAVPPSATREDVLASAANFTKVPPLGPRWTGNDMTFGEFLQKTFAMYYEWKP
jgi:isopenicillin N synthase-like dioxygenase